MSRYYGKYRGTVRNNLDPQGMGRLQVSVPAVLGEGTLSWAMPCVPFAGPGVGFFMLPPRDANVWVEFEGGDPDYPIWAGGFWGLGEAPALPAIPFIKIIKTDGMTVELDDTPGAGGITIQAGPPVIPIPCTLKFSATGIEITHGGASVKLDPVRVSVNNGALEVI